MIHGSPCDKMEAIKIIKMTTLRKKSELSRAGHQEIQGETIAKFEFFDNNFNPYSRYLDVDKVDLILRKRKGKKIHYIEVQVKYGKLYKCGPKWEINAGFDYTSWRFFKLDEFKDHHDKFYVAYVMSPDEGYKGDIFIFPSKKFHQLINLAPVNNTKKGKKAKMCIAHHRNTNRWFLWKTLNFKRISINNVVDVTKYRRNFDFKV